MLVGAGMHGFRGGRAGRSVIGDDWGQMRGMFAWKYTEFWENWTKAQIQGSFRSVLAGDDG
jgi:hypothetical protein